MRVIAVTALALVLQGCNYIFIPGEVIGAIQDGLTGERGGHCVLNTIKVGDRLDMGDGKVGVVEGLYGISHRCAQVTGTNGLKMPIRAKITIVEN